MQFTTINDVIKRGDVVGYTGTVQELGFTTQRYISQYIPVQRFTNTAGPIVPDANGTITRISKTTFAYSFDLAALSTVGVTLESPSSWAGAEAGF